MQWSYVVRTCVLAVFVAAGAAWAEDIPMTAAGKPAEGELAPFLGEPAFETQSLFEEQRFPNVVVTVEGTVLATWGGRPEDGSYLARRSEDGGETWKPEITLAEPGFHGGGVTVNEGNGDVLAFVEEGHPPRDPQESMGPLQVFRSEDDGENWEEMEVTIHPDENGHVPARHMSETGITLRHGEHAGRLLRPARVYGGGESGEGYNTAIYSDDGGATWHPSAPFPAEGTGEGTLAELSDGRIYYNSRRHWAPEGENPRMRHTAWSEDGGATWEDLSVSEVLPDGAQHRDYGLMAGLIRLPIEGRDILIFSNIESPEGRRGGTVWASFDGGETWPVKRLVKEGGFAYSSLAAGRPDTPSEGWIYLLYESGGHPESAGQIARFNLSWLLEGEPTGDGEAPSSEWFAAPAD
ncbi:MAG: sialidase family protein [Candidatus Hydrogenedentota bacterium]